MLLNTSLTRFVTASTLLSVTRLANMSTVTAAQVPMAPRNVEENVWEYPRPPALQKTPNRLQVIWFATDGTETILADTTEGYRVLETTRDDSHPPTYYLPPSALKVPLSKTSKHSFCEWKGQATYHSIQPPSSPQIANRIWSYQNPTPSFAPIRDYLSFYASPGRSSTELKGEWRCFVDGERVGVQEGDFYGGWVTTLIKGKMKGGPGTWGW